MAVTTAAAPSRPSLLSRLAESRNALGFGFMLPSAILLLVFLTYPLGLGVWLGFTDARIGRPGIFIGLENYEYLWDDSVFWLSVFNTVLYTVSASILKFMLGLWLALLLNENLPFKSFFRAVVLLPWVVPTVLSAIAFWWIYDSQFSVLSWALQQMGLIDHRINFLGDPTNARASVIAANVWRGIPFVAITLLAGLQTIPQSLYEAGTLDGASVYPREVVKIALKYNAAAMVLVHNHPSGNPDPSQADRILTKKLQETLNLVGVRTLDHIVVGREGCVSLAEQGYL